MITILLRIDETASDKMIKIENLMAARLNYDEKLSEAENMLTLFQSEANSQSEDELIKLKNLMEEIRQMKESLKQAGQPWQPERQLKITTKYHQVQNQFRNQAQKAAHIDTMKKKYNEIMQSVDQSLADITGNTLLKLPVLSKETGLSKENLAENEREIEEKLACCHVTASDLAKVKGEIRELEVLSQQIGDPTLEAELEHLATRCNSLTQEVNATIHDCTSRLGILRDSSLFVHEQLAWLAETQIAITAPHSLPLHVHEVQKLLTRLNMLEDESLFKIQELRWVFKNVFNYIFYLTESLLVTEIEDEVK